MSGQCTCWRVSGKWVASGGGLPAVCSEPSPSSPLHSLPGRRGTPGIPIMFLCCLPVCHGNVAFTSPSLPPARLTAERDGPRCVSRDGMQPSFSRKDGMAHGRRKCSRMRKTYTGGGDSVPCPHADRKEKTAVRRATRTPPSPRGQTPRRGTGDGSGAQRRRRLGMLPG